MKRMRIVIVGLALLSFGGGALVAFASDSQLSAKSVAATSLDAAAQGSVPGGLLVWMVPNSTPTANGTMVGDGVIFARMTDPQGVERITKLGDGVDARLLAGGDKPVLLIKRDSGDCSVLAYDPASSKWIEELSLSETPSAICASGGVLTYASPEARNVLLSRVQGATSDYATFSLPVVVGSEASPGEISANHGPPVDGPSSIATAIAGIGNHVLAFSSSGDAYQVTDLAGGVTKVLGSGASVGAACPAPDGRIYAVELGNEPGQTIKVAGFDASLAAVSLADTGWSPSPVGDRPRLNRLQLLPSDTGVVLFLEELAMYPQTIAPAHVWLVNGDQVRELGPLRDGVGINAGWGRDNSILLFGGSAKNSVSRLSLETGNLAPVEEMESPEGSWVLVAAE